MSQLIEVLIPDIGNFDSVDVIEVLVKAGDTIAKEEWLLFGDATFTLHGVGLVVGVIVRSVIQFFISL
jgi:hypothetical protein